MFVIKGCLFIIIYNVVGSSVGIILPPNEDKEVYELLEDILHGVVGEKPPAVAEERAGRERRTTGISGVISRGLVTGKLCKLG